jgi:thioredoxin 1
LTKDISFDNIVTIKKIPNKGRRAMYEGMVQLTESNFDSEISQSSIPILVDFWAVWCGPCKMIAPELEKLHEEKKNVLRIGKLNVDENRDIAIRYGISSIPTLLLFKNGEVVKKLIGAMSKDKILNEISSFI